MKKIVYKWFWSWHLEKEEQWLNDMSKQGWQLENVSLFKYTFKKDSQNEYLYRIEMLDTALKDNDRQEYIELVEETGAQKIANLGNWIYFRKKTELGDFNLFSDIDSVIKHLDRISILMAIFIPCTVLSFVNLLVINKNTIKVLNIEIAINIFIIVQLIIGGLLIFGLYQIFNKKKKLEKERQLHE